MQSVPLFSKVTAIDFGNKDIVAAKDLRVLPNHFIKPASFAMHCCLWGLKPAGDPKVWSKTATEYMHTRIRGKLPFLVPVSASTASAAVQLYLSHFSLIQSLYL